MKIKVLRGTNRITSGTILEARKVEIRGMSSYTAYQCISGPYTGVMFHPFDVLVVEESASTNKVKLPREVAEALDRVKKRYRIHAIMDAIQNRYDGFGLTEVYAWVYKNAGSVQEGDSKDAIMTALVNGYEVGESPEEKLENDLVNLISEWMFSEPEEDDNRVLAKKIIKRMEHENKQSG